MEGRDKLLKECSRGMQHEPENGQTIFWDRIRRRDRSGGGITELLD